MSWGSIFPYSHKRNNKDTAQDVLLLLYLFDRAGNNISGNDVLKTKIKLMKLVFLIEKKMVEIKRKGFNFFFNIYKRGPSSKELLQLIDDLKRQELIDLVKDDKSKFTFLLTQRGKMTIKDFVTSDGKNEEFFEIVKDILKEYGRLTPDEILEKVYSMKVKPMYSNDEPIHIGTAVKQQPRKRLLMKLNEEDVEKELEVSADWIETVNVLMNQSLSK